ncbi:MAG TPA: peptidoglycan DD-metalloendopeptidase family protein, partial [Ktedonobacteraceae bacterium]|nr:peptidoglycan DD-metalloendopeptidase family protein [Ktedonobacteraceae bacterium]
CTGGVNCYDGHNGYDLNLRFEPVVSAAAGTVIRAGWYNPLDHNSSLGLWVAIDHGNGYYTAYGHLSALTVSTGQQVGTQWQIGTSGTTGSSTGPHLHMATYYAGSWGATDPFGWSGNYPDPNVVPDNYLWVSNPGTNNTIPDLSSNGSAVYPGATLVDDGAAGWSSSGTWNSAKSGSDISGGLHWTPTTGGSATATATWQPQLPASGYYEVGVFIDDNNASSSWAPYTIYSADPNHPGTMVNHTVYVDQTHIGSFQGPYSWENTGPQWIGLGTYYFSSTANDRVAVSNATGENGAQLAADGMEFVPVSGQAPPYGEKFNSLTLSSTLLPGATVWVQVTVQNTGSITWPASGNNNVTLGYTWQDANGHLVSPKQGDSLWQASTLPGDVAPGGTVSIPLTLHTPALAGSYSLILDCQQQDTWFASHGATPLTLRVTITPWLPIIPRQASQPSRPLSSHLTQGEPSIWRMTWE